MSRLAFNGAYWAAYVYDGDNLIAEYCSDGTLLRKYVYGLGIDEPVCIIEVADGSRMYYYHYDGLGSVVALTDSGGVKVRQYRYDVFGIPTITNFTTRTIGNRFMFTGREYDSEGLMGLYYYRARYYRPSIGRFLQTDPLGMQPDGGKQNRFRPLKRYAHGMNIYSYVNNRTINYKDPMGLDAPGCDLVWNPIESPCMLDCCAKHDACYANNGCNMTSWWGCDGKGWIPAPPPIACFGCNIEVVACVASCGPAAIIW